MGTKKFTTMLAAASMVFFMCVTAVPASASVTALVDQQQTDAESWMFGPLPIPRGPMGQTFTPTVNNITGFDINVSMYPPGGEGPGLVGTFTFEIWDWDTKEVLASIPDVTGSGDIHVDLPAPVALVPGDRYTIMVTAASPPGDVIMAVALGDHYPGGWWEYEGGQWPYYDAWFRTYYDPYYDDTTPPTITVTTPPIPPATYLQDEVVFADFECADAESGIASCEGNIAWANESVPMVDGQPIDTSRLSTVIGPNASWTVVATDNAGNTSSVHGSYYVADPEPFSGRFVVNISTEPDGQSQYVNGWGWKHGPVTIYLGGWDNPIGTASIGGDAGEGGFFSMVDPGSFAPGDTVLVMDAVGNVTSLSVANLAVTSIDPATGDVAGTCDVGMDVNLEYSTDDAHPNPTQLVAPCTEGSFEASFSPNELPNYPEGSYVEARQWEGDGDGTQVDAWYPQYLSYDWTGFFRPVDNQPTLNMVKAGQAIPVKFSLGGDQGLDLFSAGSGQVACDASGGTDTIEVTVAAGGSSLSYDPVTDTYTYAWKTTKAWAGTCRTLIVTLDDGTEHLANFRFTK